MASRIIETEGTGRGLHLNVKKTEIFWTSIDPRSIDDDVFPPDIGRPSNGVKLLGGPVSLDLNSISDMLVYLRIRKFLGLLSDDDKDLRPADILVLNWENGKDVCMDVTWVSPITGEGGSTVVKNLLSIINLGMISISILVLCFEFNFRCTDNMIAEFYKDVGYTYCLNFNIDVVFRNHKMSLILDKKWMKCDNKSEQYIEGVRLFIQLASEKGGANALFACPCGRCKNNKGLVTLTKISLHLPKYGIYQSYTTWRFHGETSEVETHAYRDNSSEENIGDNVAENVSNVGDNVGVVAEDVDPAVGVDEDVGLDSRSHVDAGTSRSKKKKLLYERARAPLYPSCPKDNACTALLELIKELLPEENTLPSKYADIKNLIQELGMNYVTYDACVNDCILYWKDHALLVKCPVCQEPRYKKVFNDERKLTTVAQKTLRHFYREFSLLVLLISGPRAHGKDIDVYLQPLIDELKKLWNEGVLTYDSFTKTEFVMKARLLYAIHDFPALGTLYGCVTHGYYACPTCGEETDADYLPFSKKTCYMGHCRWLPSKHKYRDDKKNFNGVVDHRPAPWLLTGLQIQEIVRNISCKKGKGKHPSAASLKRKRKAEGENEDAANVEYVFGDHSLFSRSKSKDGPAARKNMEAMGVKKKLWLKKDDVTGKTSMENGTFSLTKREKVFFCSILKNLRVPSRFSSNLRNCINVNPPELKNFKSHDYHVVMQHLLPLLIHTANSLPKELRVSLLRISIFFNVLFVKVINRQHLLRAKASMIEAMCVFEKKIPPSFFVISIHLMVHLADEALISDSVRFRWMYPFER
ncbi:uncharacterized protein LOC113334575 [Papaver somniferum]|uniref:uncharacterized protein LOC113334575 n=1 Tax=Papaver somniferum TaxID=3469 RepID=UPI000E705496|nr:uncharacterized protein LOC113334575 [Papaver somniferum]